MEQLKQTLGVFSLFRQETQLHTAVKTFKTVKSSKYIVVCLSGLFMAPLLGPN